MSTMTAYVMLATALVEGGEPEAGLEILPNVVSMSRQFGMKSVEGLTLLSSAEAHLFKGDATAALASLDDALPICRETGNHRLAGKALRVRGAAALAVGDLQLAESSLRSSEAMLREMDALYELGLTLCAQAELRRVQRDEACARRLFDEAEALYAGLSLEGPRSLVRARRDASGPR
jgi:tetratricopeptide (TPR) repeat protein